MVRDPTNVRSAANRSQLPVFYAHISDNIVARDHSSADIVGGHLPHMQLTIVMNDVLTASHKSRSHERQTHGELTVNKL